MGDNGHAKEHFETLLIFAPKYSIQKFEPSDSCNKLFSKVAKQPEPAKKKEIKSDLSIDEKSVNPVQETKAILKPSDDTQSWKLWMPYGVGQFMNGQSKKGTFFLVSEATMTASALTTFILFQREDKIGDRYVHGDRAKAYQLTFWSSLGAGIVLYVWGVIDAKSNYPIKGGSMAALRPSRESLAFNF